MESLNKHIINNKTSSSEEVKQRVFEILETVSDPEVPVLSVIDLGIIRDVIVTPPSGGRGVRSLR